MRVNEELVHVTEWILNRLSVNVSKTFAILFTNRYVNRYFGVVFGGDAIACEASGSFIGIIADDSLKFDKHISKICSKL